MFVILTIYNYNILNFVCIFNVRIKPVCYAFHDWTFYVHVFQIAFNKINIEHFEIITNI